MGREIRRVPINWSHPKKKDGSYRPLSQYNFIEIYKDWEDDLKKWYERHGKWQKGFIYSWEKKCFIKFIEISSYDNYTEYAGDPPSPPNPDDLMPKGKWYQLYENVSEGTPLSPPFHTKEELSSWLCNNKDFWGVKRDKEAADFIVNEEWCPSGILVNGIHYKPEEQHLLRKKIKQ